MKILFSSIGRTVRHLSVGTGVLKPKNFSVLKHSGFSREIPRKKNFGKKLLEFFGVKKKLNPKSFADGSHTPKGPYVASEKSVMMSDKYLKTGYLSENDRIVNGFRDGGRNAKFTRFGDAVYADREIITVDLQKDVYLRNLISYVHKNADTMSEKSKMKFLFNLIKDISGDKAAGKKFANNLAVSRQGEEVLLGKVFEHSAAVCRHKSMLAKLLGDELGLKTRLIKGNLNDILGGNAHVWNEIKLSNGKKYLFDVQQGILMDLSNKSAFNNYTLSMYSSLNNRPVYM